MHVINITLLLLLYINLKTHNCN